LAFRIAAISGTYVLRCVPAILLAEAYKAPQWLFHTSQLAAVLICLGAAVAYLRLSGSNPDQTSPSRRALALAAVILCTLWLAFIVFAFASYRGIDDL
jgi:hypothetical protein